MMYLLMDFVTLTFLMRYSPDDRIRKAVSPEGLQFFQALCGQLAGRYDTAREFADCASAPGVKQHNHN